MNMWLKSVALLSLFTLSLPVQSAVLTYNWTGSMDVGISTPNGIFDLTDPIYGTVTYDNLGALVEDFGSSSLFLGGSWTYVIESTGAGVLTGGFSNANTFVLNGNSDQFYWKNGDWSGVLIDGLTPTAANSNFRLDYFSGAFSDDTLPEELVLTSLISRKGTICLAATPCDGSTFQVLFNINDIQLVAVPVPAAVWLFGSGLLGLIGIARRKKAV